MKGPEKEIRASDSGSLGDSSMDATPPKSMRVMLFILTPFLTAMIEWAIS